MENFDIRSPAIDTNAIDVHIIGFAMEQSAPDKPIVENIKVSTFTVHYILSGKGYAEVDGQKHTITQDTFVIGFPNAPLITYQDPNEPWSFAWFTLDGLKIKNYLERVGITAQNPILKLERDEKLRALLIDAPQEMKARPYISDIIGLKFFFSILERIALQTTDHHKTDALMNTQERHVAAAIEYINNHFQDSSLNLNIVANEVGVSPKYLSIIFKKVTQNTFSKHLYNKRMSAALTLIDSGNNFIKDIAHRCGFSSPYYFSNQFKKYNSLSPKHSILERLNKREPKK